MTRSLSHRFLAIPAFVLLLGGCFYDAAPRQIRYHNDTDATVVVTVTVPGIPREQPVPSGDSVPYSLDECRGTSIVVRTEGGDLIGVVEGPACPGWELTVNADGSIDYAEG